MKIKPDWKYTNWKAGDIGINEFGNLFLCLSGNSAAWLSNDNGKDFLFNPERNSSRVIMEYPAGYIGTINQLSEVLSSKIDIDKKT